MSDKKDPSKSPRDTNGPVVKTGPTAGQNRSRNTDGAWRKKRSDTGESKKKSGCFLSTAACAYMGLPDDCRELQTLRWFRDSYLLSTSEGIAMVDHYYKVAPNLTEHLTDPGELQYVWQVIQRSIKAINGSNYELATREYRCMVQALEKKYPGSLERPKL